MIHIGSKIKEVVKKRGMTTVNFADKINYSRRNVYSIFKKPSIDTNLLIKISELLEHNFFEYYNSYMTSIYEIEDHVDLFNESWDDMVKYKTDSLKSKDLIMALEKEVEYLKEINDLLRKKG